MIDSSLVFAVVLVLLVCFGLIAEVLHPRSDSRATKLLRLILLVASCIAAHRMAFPPEAESAEQTLVVLSGEIAALPEPAPDQRLIALPGSVYSDAEGRVSAVADLAAARRQFPQPSNIRLMSQGLGARDLYAAADLPVVFEPGDPPLGIIALQAPTAAAPGRMWLVKGRVSAALEGELRLIDPTGEVVATARADADGQFSLGATTPVPGSYLYRLALTDAGEGVIDQLQVPVLVRPADPLRLMLWSESPNPESKYLRRWALDAGLQLSSRMNLRPRMSMAQGEPALGDANLARTDLVIIEDRGWMGLSQQQRAQVLSAVDGGLGLLLRLTDEPDAAMSARLAELGFSSGSVELSRVTRLPALAGAGVEEMGPPIQRRTLALSAVDGRPLLLDEQGEPLGVWRPSGSGRLGVFWVSDTHRLTLVGEQTRFASLWADLVATLARFGVASGVSPATARHWVNQRIDWCDAGSTASVTDSSGQALELVAGVDGCLSYWPTQPGWHQWRQGEREASFFVRMPDDGTALRAQQQIEWNQLLASSSRSQTATTTAVPGPRWPWAALWLLLSGGLWWLERRAAGPRAIA